MNNLADHLRNAYPDKKQKDLIPMLQDIQKQYGYISENHIQLASEMLNVSGSNIYDIASFYDQFKFTPKAKIEIKICTCPACHIIRSHKLMAFLKLKLNIQEKFRTICIPKNTKSHKNTTG
jgi:NADH-quinone oxidoreductase subunit E